MIVLRFDRYPDEYKNRQENKLLFRFQVVRNRSIVERNSCSHSITFVSLNDSAARTTPT